MKKFLVIGALVLALFAALCACGVWATSNQGPGDSNLPTPASTSADVPTISPSVSPSNADVDPTTAPASRPARAVTLSIPNGQWLVGTDVPAGRYQSAGPDGDYMCYWQLTTAPNAQPGDSAFITNDSPPGHAYVTLRKGEYFQTSHCQAWTLAP